MSLFYEKMSSLQENLNRDRLFYILRIPPLKVSARDAQRITLVRQEEISLSELRNAVEKITDFQTKIDSLEVIANDFSKKVDHNLAVIDSDEKKITKMIEALNLRFHNLNMLYEKIESSKKAIEEYLSKFETVKNLTEENMDLKYKLTRAAEERSRVLIERPILSREEVSMLEKDMFSLRTQIEMIKKELQLEKEKNSALVNENQALAKERKDLLERLQDLQDEKLQQYREYKELHNQKMDLEQRLRVLTDEVESLRRAPKVRVSIWDEPKEVPNQQSMLTMKKLMDQNEKLITEINALKNERNRLLNIENLQNPDAKGLYEAHQKVFELEKKNVELQGKINALKNELDYQKAVNSELMQKLKTTEYQYQQLNIEHSSLKEKTKRDTSTPVSPRRIFDKETPGTRGSIIDQSTVINNPLSPNSRTTYHDPNHEIEKLRAQLEAEKRWSEHLANELQKTAKKF